MMFLDDQSDALLLCIAESVVENLKTNHFLTAEVMQTPANSLLKPVVVHGRGFRRYLVFSRTGSILEVGARFIPREAKYLPTYLDTYWIDILTSNEIAAGFRQSYDAIVCDLADCDRFEQVVQNATMCLVTSYEP